MREKDGAEPEAECEDDEDDEDDIEDDVNAGAIGNADASECE